MVKGLWNSWDDDAFLYDRSRGVYFDRSKMHVLNHKGKYFKVRGPLNVARSPQGQPVLVQAGASESGMELAAETAEVVFAAQSTLEGGKAFYSNVKGRMAKFAVTRINSRSCPVCQSPSGERRMKRKKKPSACRVTFIPRWALDFSRRDSHLIFAAIRSMDHCPNLPKNDLAASRVDMVVAMAKRENLYNSSDLRAVCRGTRALGGDRHADPDRRSYAGVD